MLVEEVAENQVHAMPKVGVHHKTLINIHHFEPFQPSSCAGDGRVSDDVLGHSKPCVLG